jgi:arabinogalactan endo-1,4-beta-galactosidase
VAWTLALLLGAFPAQAEGLLRGADLSVLPQVEAGGAVFQDDDVPTDVLSILRARGVDTIRIRLWRTPADGAGGLAEALALAERATAAGCGVLLDLHYSDCWADPGHQSVPAAWTGLAPPALADSARSYTRDVLRAFAARGVVPRCVLIGNEITAGMLWDTGRVGGSWDTDDQWTQLAALVRAGIAGVDEALPDSLRPAIMVHIDRGADNAGARWFLDNLVSRQVDFDLIGVSFYPWWHGTLKDLDANLDDLATRYDRTVVVVETAYPWTLGWFDGAHNAVGLPGMLLPGYPATPAGQREFLSAVMEIVRTVPDGRGGGVFWWAPEWIASPGFGSRWENLALFDEEGRPLPALAAFGAAAAVGRSAR